MKSKKEIIRKIELLSELLSNEEADAIMGVHQRSKIKIKMSILNWVLDEPEPIQKQGEKHD